MWPAMLTKLTTRECQCCCQQTSIISSARCSKNHVICSTCKTRLNRKDCLFCQPHQTTETVRQINRDMPNNRARSNPISPARPARPASPASALSTVEHQDIRIEITRTNDTHPIPGHRQKLNECVTDSCGCVSVLCKYGLIFMTTVYLGKVYFAFFYYCNPQFDSTWTSWDKFDYIIAEAFCGLIGSALLYSCCCIRNNA